MTSARFEITLKHVKIRMLTHEGIASWSLFEGSKFELQIKKIRIGKILVLTLNLSRGSLSCPFITKSRISDAASDTYKLKLNEIKFLSNMILVINFRF